MLKPLKILAAFDIIANAKYKKYKANAPRISPANSASKTPLSPAETCRQNSSAQTKSFKQIGDLFEKFIPHTLLKPERSGPMSRRRLFSKENTFWAFFCQVLDADGGCKEVIRKLQSYASIKGEGSPIK